NRIRVLGWNQSPIVGQQWCEPLVAGTTPHLLHPSLKLVRPTTQSGYPRSMPSLISRVASYPTKNSEVAGVLRELARGTPTAFVHRNLLETLCGKNEIGFARPR